MLEALDRHELPLQSVIDRNEDITATVPVHLEIQRLPSEIRVNSGLIVDANGTVRKWFNEDMEQYLDVLKREGFSQHLVRGYETFSDEWSLGSTDEGVGYLDLHWMEHRGTRTIGLVRLGIKETIPTILYNQLDENGSFYTHDPTGSEIFYRYSNFPDVIYMTPEKMRQYGTEEGPEKIDLSRGIAEVRATVFASEYQSNMARALLLRNFAVFYLNRLLEQADSRMAA